MQQLNDHIIALLSASNAIYRDQTPVMSPEQLSEIASALGQMGMILQRIANNELAAPQVEARAVLKAIASTQHGGRPLAILGQGTSQTTIDA